MTAGPIPRQIMTAVNRLACDNNGQGVRLSQSRRPCDSISGSRPIPAAEVVIQPATYHGKVFVFLQHKRLVTRHEARVLSEPNRKRGLPLPGSNAEQSCNLFRRQPRSRCRCCHREAERPNTTNSFSLTSTFLPALEVAFGCRTKIASDIKTGPSDS